MTGIWGVVFIISFFGLIIGTVMVKAFSGEKIMVLGKKDKREMFFGFGYLVLLYTILSNVVFLPMPAFINKFFINWDFVGYLGIAFCALGTLGYIICTLDFWQSVRIGVDYEHAGKLTTTGIYRYSRNPMYLSFLLLFFGEFLIFPNLGLLVCFVVAALSFHLQVLKEEAFLKEHYGKEYLNYYEKVRRYV